ncbi:MAG: CRTAC1 family protein [Planctomycetes bacterium]|nr:CRTAC1 family protein [Planctomycetota bacterium]
MSLAETRRDDKESGRELALLGIVSRIHIVVIASLGTLTFGWIFTGRYPWLAAWALAFVPPYVALTPLPSRSRASFAALAAGVALALSLPARAQEGPLFENATAAAGLAGVEGARVAFADLDGDGDPDAILDQTKVFHNNGAGRFARSDGDAPLQPEGARRADVVQVGDVNGDGFADLYLGRSTDLSGDGAKDDGLRSEIWLADGKGGFARKEDSGVGARAETTISACFLDYDRDGNLDLFVGNAYVAYGKSLEAFPNRLYRGKGDGTFEDTTERAGLLGVAEPGRADSRRPTYGVAHTDWNDDGLQDLLVCTYGRQWNRLWKNGGDGTFTDVAPETSFDGDDDESGKYPEGIDREDEAPFRANGNTFDCAVADFDGDGDMDCFLAEITHWWAGPSSDLSMLLVNQGKDGAWRFRREPDRIGRVYAAPDWNQGDLHAGWLDIENDGLLDLAIASSDYPDQQILRLWHQESDGSFVAWTDRLGFSWVNASQISFADFDRDGATDMLVGRNHMRLTPEQRTANPLAVGLFRNLAAARAGNRFLSLRLSGQAVGARVTLFAGGRRQTREVHGGLGHAGHRDDAECRFGVGKAAKVDRLEVRWPDAAGTIQVFEDIETNRFYRLAHGGKLEPATR